jgi:2-oxoisovalerate dehydrogenase E1 component
MLRESVRLAQEEQRVVIFIEPIALYMKKDLHQEGDALWSFDYKQPSDAKPIKTGELGCFDKGKDLCIISYGNGYYLSRQAEKILAESGIQCTVIDLRWLAPLNEKAIVAAIGDITNVLIVDECRKTGSISEAIVTLLIEHDVDYSSRKVERLTAHDSFIPLGLASFQVLPSCELIVEQAKRMVGVENK